MRAYTANMIPGGTTPTINVSQYDNDYAVTVTLIEGAEIYTPPVGATIRVEGTKPDGHGFEYPCTYQGNVVTMPIYTQMTAVSGRFPIELVVYQSGLRVGSCNIVFAVEKAPLGEDTDISETVIPDIIDAAQASAEAAQEAAETAQEAAAEVLSSQIVTEASGSIAAFSDGANDVAVKSLVAEITPVQSGSGDPSPSNIRPISGRTGMTVTRAGKNLIQNIKYQSNANTVYLGANTANYELYLPAGTYTFSVEYLNNTHSVAYYRFVSDSANRTLWTPSSTSTTGTITVDKDENFNIWLYQSGGFSASNIGKFQIEAGSTTTPYTPYVAPTTYPITWQTQAGTVYGGTLNVTTGVLTVNGVLHTLTGDEDFSLATSSRRFTKAFATLEWERANTVLSTQNQSNSICSHATYLTGATGTATPADYRISTDSSNAQAINFYDTQSEYANAAAFNAYLAAQYANGTPVQLYYDLATPLDPIQLSPTEIKTLLGNNSIYTDAGSVSVEYVADTKLYIDNKIAELQALVLEN